MSADLLKVDSLRAFYGRAQVLFDVSLTVGRGEVVALMGRNGAGKSTTFKALMGHLNRTSGRIEFLGKKILGLPTHKIARLGLGFVPEDRRIFTDLTTMEISRPGGEQNEGTCRNGRRKRYSRCFRICRK
jgi:branched-chain amino acid transport system ATP-binding protein